MTTSQGIMWTRRAFTAGQIILIIGLCFYSLMTTTPLVAAHSEWAWSGWALGAMADAAFIMAITADSTLARHGVTHLGGWVRAFKWFTGLAVVYLNIWTAVEARDPVGVAIHIIAPALVMLLAEVGPIYTAALAQAEKAAGAPDHPIPHVPAAEPVEGRMEVPPLPLTPTQKAMRFTEVYGAGPSTISEAGEAVDTTTHDSAETTAITVPAQPAVDAEGGAQLAGQAAAIGAALDADKPARMSNSEADKIIEEGWRYNQPADVVAKATGRHVQTVRRKYREHEEQNTSNAA